MFAWFYTVDWPYDKWYVHHFGLKFCPKTYNKKHIAKWQFSLWRQLVIITQVIHTLCTRASVCQSTVNDSLQRVKAKTDRAVSICHTITITFSLRKDERWICLRFWSCSQTKYPIDIVSGISWWYLWLYYRQSAQL